MRKASAAREAAQEVVELFEGLVGDRHAPPLTRRAVVDADGPNVSQDATYIHCGAPIAEKASIGAHRELCGACE